MATLKQFQFMIISCLVGLCLSQVAEKFTGLNPCTEKTTCRECIQTLSCAWCSQPDFGDQRRCFQPSMISDSETCMEKYIYQPDNKIIPLENRELTKGSSQVGGGGAASANASASGGTSSDNIVQIKPQRVKLALRINEALKLEVFYSQAEDYPVDLYYLMDLSKSMEDDKDNLSKLGGLLSDTMRKMTSNFRLGFGSFVDKVVMPYVSIVPKNLAEPCPKCASPYGFRNVMKLSVDTDKFATQVEKAAISGNLDAPEGGFDAIMQAVVCRNEIGWREKARRLLVFSTDAGFHYAGDGKLGGIVKPNDGQCHLDGEGLYTHSSLQDYPSISQLNLKVKDNAINLIFAVTGEQISIYDRLKEHIEGSSAGKLSNDSSNVVDFVKEQYSKISSSVEMKDNSTSAVNIKYYSSCLEGGPEKLTSKCDGLKVGDRVKFTAEITVTSCPEKRQDWNQIIQIYPVGIKESLIIDLEMLCDCPCERPGNDEYEENSAKCHNAGAFSCGICECDSQHFGQTCECSADTVTSSIHNDTRVCKADNVTTVDCSGRGTCTCGQCKCHTRNNNERITGKYCECDNFSCDRHNGLLCSGETHGKCECGRCVCNEEYTGKACDCLTSTKACIPPGGGEVCSGHGTCHCGQCSCDVKTGGERYSGPYCDYCPTCSSPCEAFIPCIECQAYETGPLMDDDSCSNCSFVPASAQIIIADDDKGEHLCSHVDADDCRFSFVYGYNNRDVYVRTQEKRECPPQVFMLGVVLGVIAAIVFIGLALLLLWKMVTTIHDRREFAKFEKERSTAKWDTGENPIYKQATSTFRNPTYSGR